jgi:hypothetical protein
MENQMVSKLLCVLPSVLSLNAQISTALNRFPSRSPEVEIQNNSGVNLTAFAISMAPAGNSGDSAPFVYFTDGAIETDRLATVYDLPLPPNQKCSVPVPSGLKAGHQVDLFTPPIIHAEAFADGTTAGDPALLARLLSRRGSMLQAVELAHEVLTDAGKHNVPRGQLIKQFRTMADSLNHWYLPLEQRVGRALFQSVSEELLSLPPSPVGSAFPPTAFVQEQTATLNRQRTTLLAALPSPSLGK